MTEGSIPDNQKDTFVKFFRHITIAEKDGCVSSDYQDGAEAGGVGIPCHQFCSFTIFDEVLYGS